MAERTILHYQIVERIGAGGMGEVYKARDTRLNRFVAIKALTAGMAADSDRRLRFIQEAQAVSALNHPNIITIYDIVADAGAEYMVIEYVDGKTLVDLIPKSGLPVPQAIRYALQIVEALSAAHAAGIVHRDLKPANIMVNSAGLLKVLDFGLAKLTDGLPANPDGATVTMMPAPLTIEGSLLGTVNYMSPEQAEGKPIDARSDIFSFGAVLYEMLTGQRAFSGNTVVSTLTAVLRDEVRPIRQLAPTVPPPFDNLVMQCLKKDPAQRPQSMREIQSTLTALARPPLPRRSPFAKAALPIVILIALAAGAGYWWKTTNRPHATAPPRIQTASAPPVLHEAIPAPAPPPPVPITVTLTDGTPVLLVLTRAIPDDAKEGDPVFFKAASNVTVNDVIVIAKGATATGVIADAPKRILGIGGKMTFSLDAIGAVNGQKIPIRATPDPPGISSKRAVENGAKEPKGIAALAGAAYTGYIDGAKTLSLQK